MCNKKLFCFLLYIAFAANVSAQDNISNSLDSFSAKFISSVRTTGKERAYLVTDRSVFIAGEYIWFKTFLLNTASQKLSNKSKYLFVDIVNDKDDAVQTLILDATNRQLSSRIILPDSLPAGYYWLRAYTRQMAEYDTDEIAVKPLFVFGKANDNNVAKPKKKAVTQDDMPAITFYPEGGNIMTGINSTVAVLTTINNGEPLHVEGVIKDNRDTIAARFTTNANGLAKFEFEPSGYRRYRAIINWNGKEISYFLPAFNFHAGQLSVLHQTGIYKLRILLGDSIYTKDALTYVVGISKDSLVFAGIGKGLCEVNVEETKLPPGITTFYLFSKEFTLLSERSVYASNNNVHVTVATDKSTYTKRDKVLLNLTVADVLQHGIPSLLAVSVSDSLLGVKEPCSDNETFNLHSVDNLFLAGNPCFTDDNIDLMMLTKNDTYQTINKHKIHPPANPDDDLLFIKGIVLSDKNIPLADKAVMLISNSGNNNLFYMDTTNNEGHFHFPLEHRPDSMQVAIEVKDLNNNRILNCHIILDAIAYPKLTTPTALKEYLTIEPRTKQRITAYYNAQLFNNEKQLPPITVKKVVDYDESKRVSPYSTIIAPKDLDGRSSVDNLILRVSGLQLLNGYLVIHGLSAFKSPSAASEPLVLVDGAEVALSSGIGTVSPVMGYLSSLDPKDIEFIEILKDGTAANYGVRGGNGVILINLNKKIRDLSSNANNMKMFYVKGITSTAIFPNISYDHKDKKSTPAEDTRSTLFWNGNFFTAGTDNATLNFYTSDIPSTYIISVTGITLNGDIIRKTITVQSR